MNLLKQSVLFTLTSFVLVASVFAGSENQNSMNGMNKSAQIQLDSEKGINVKKMPLKEDGIIMSQREWKAMQPRVDRPQVETLNRVTTVPNTRDELLFESFETAVPPDGWTLVDHNGGGYGWEQNATQASDGSFSAYCNDYSGDQATELVSPSIDLSGFSSASLTFWQYQNWGSYYNYHDITVYLGGVAYAATELGAGTEDTWEEVVFDLSEFVDESNLQIGFNYSGNWADQWWIDGVTISGSAETVTYGCTDETACNYDETATDDDGSCTYAENGFDCEGNCEFNALGITMNDSYGDGWSGNILTVGDYSYTLESGNTGESGACLEDGLYMVTCDGGTWQSEVSWVISDANGDTLLADGAPYSGSLTLGEAEDVPGCMDETACNYDETATVDDGSCTYPDYGFDCDGNCDANLLEVSMYDSWGDGWNGNILTIGDFQYTLAEGDTAEAGACLSDGLYNVTCDGGSFQYEVSWEIATEDGTVLLDGGAPYSGMLTVGETADVPGCMDETAANYNPEATIDDGSCVWSGDVCEYPLQAVAGSNEATGADQWFAYTATLTGTITVSSAGSGTDTKVWAYSDCETALGVDDDGLGFPPGESELTFDVTSGTDYHIMWDDQWGPDPFTWTLSEEEYATAPNLTATGIPGAVQLAWDDVPTRHSAEHSGPAVSLFTNLDPTISAQKRALLPQNDHSFLNPGHESGVRSTDVVIVCDGGAWQGEVSWEIFNADGDTVAAGGAPDTVEASLDDGVYMVYAHDSYGDGWNGNVLSVTGTDGNVYLSYTLDSGLEGEASFTISSTAVYGCTDNTATNYGQNCAGEDVGTPTIDDGCCVYPPPANDDCEDAESVTGPYPADISGTTVDATISYPGVLDFVDVWYAVDLPHDFNSVTLSLCNSPQAIGNTLVVAYTSCDDASVNNSISYNTLAWYECENISYAPTLNWTIPGPGTAYIPVYTGGPMDFAGTVDVQEIYVPTFNLYRGGESLASGIAGNDYTDEDVTGGMEYCYTVEQNLPDGSVSGMSDEACATPDAEITEGETLADAIMIDALPYVTTNNSSFYVNDYDESCPYTGSTAPDVVYSYSPMADMLVDVSLCGASTDYDSKLYIYENDTSMVAGCNDDACSTDSYPSPYVSDLSAVTMTAGNTYYIVVDGYSSFSGNFELSVAEWVEPPCEDDAFEDDDTKDQAVDHGGDGTWDYALCFADNAGGLGQPSGSAAVDWSVVNLSPLTTLTAITHGTGDAGNDIDLFIEAYDGDGVCAWGGGDDLAGSGNLDSEEMASYSNLSDSDMMVYVGVIYYGGEDPIPYQLTITTTGIENADAPQNLTATVGGLMMNDVDLMWDPPYVNPSSVRMSQNPKKDKILPLGKLYGTPNGKKHHIVHNVNIEYTEADLLEKRMNMPPIQIPNRIEVGRTEDFTLVMTDSWGDGWDGAYMDVSVNGTVVHSAITVDTDEATFTIAVDNGDLVETAYTSGSYENEHSYAFYDQNGTFVAGDGPYPSAGINFTVVITSDIPGCMDETACNYNPEATADDGSCEYPEEGMDCEGNCTDPALSTVVFDLMDSYGDGWNGNALIFGGDVMTIDIGSEASFTYCLDDGDYDYQYDGSGSWHSENSWTVSNEDGVLSSGIGAPGVFDYSFTVGGEAMEGPDLTALMPTHFEHETYGWVVGLPIANIGDMDAPPGFHELFHNDIDLGYFGGDPVAAGDTITYMFYDTFMGQGDNAIYHIADFYEEVDESDETNNTSPVYEEYIEITCADDNFEENDSSTNSAAIEPGTYELVHCSADADWFEITINNGQSLNLTVTEGEVDTSGLMDVGIWVFEIDPQYTQVYSPNLTSHDVSWSNVTDQPLVVNFAVGDFWVGGFEGSYTMTVEVTDFEQLTYSVYRDGGVIASDLLLTGYLDAGVDVGDHTYSVTANYGGAEGSHSNEVTVTIQAPPDPPPAATNLTAESACVGEEGYPGIQWSWSHEDYTLITDCAGNEVPEGYVSYIGDGWCDDGTWGVDFNCEAWNYDDGDCDSGGGEFDCTNAAFPGWVGDGWCDSANNSDPCWDGGDCCEGSCDDGGADAYSCDECDQDGDGEGCGSGQSDTDGDGMWDGCCDPGYGGSCDELVAGESSDETYDAKLALLGPGIHGRVINNLYDLGVQRMPRDNNLRYEYVIFDLVVNYGGTYYPFQTFWNTVTVNFWTEGEEACAVVHAISDEGVNSEASNEACGTASCSSETDVAVDHSGGWNMLSLAVGTDMDGVDDVFAGAVAVYGYPYSETVTNVENGAGYWVRYESAGSSTQTGAPVEELLVGVSEGWNLVGSISEDAGIGDSDGIVVALYGYPYSEEVTAIEPGSGYWVRTSADGSINLDSGAGMPRLVSEIDANTLTFNGMKLHFGIEVTDELALSHSLPPKPPAGSFDVRFAGDSKIAESSGSIEVMNSSNELVIDYTIVHEAGDRMQWVLSTDAGDEMILEGNGSLSLPGDVTGLSLNRVPEIPEQFALIQNFPNPFNPVTNISYQLPEASEVTVSVYNMMGQKIAELVSGHVPAGYHSVVWDSRNLQGEAVSSGVYLYTITAGDFYAMKKMVLMK